MTGMALDTPAVSTRFANDDDRWSAVARRDPAADGEFFYSVRTTGVYCRPSCAARLPRRGNVSFHRTTCGCRTRRLPAVQALPAERRAAGRTARRRCCQGVPPDRGGGDHADSRRARRERRDEPLPFPPRLQGGHRGDAEGVCGGASRQARARASCGRANGDRRDLRRRLQFQRPLLRDRRQSARHDADRLPRRRLRRRRSASPSANARSARSWSPRARRASARSCSATIRMRSRAICRTASRSATLIGGDAEFERWVAKVVGFVEAPRLGLDLPLDVRGTAFQQRVWQALREIPAGATASYAEIAERIGAPSAVRAVAQACARQRARGGDPVPPRGAERRRAVRLSLGRRAQARAARARGCAVSTRSRPVRPPRSHRSRGRQRSTGRGWPMTSTRTAVR